MMNNGEQAIVLAKTLGAMAKEADMVRVVRCKDCKFFEGGYCWFFDSVVDADGFCYKAKKEGDEE